MRRILAALCALLSVAPAVAQVVGSTPSAFVPGQAPPALPPSLIVPPALPLATGAKVMFFGHSFAQRGADSGPTASSQFNAFARAASGWAVNDSTRYNVDVIADPAKPLNAGVLTYLNGSYQGIAGDHLAPCSPLAGTIARTRYALGRTPDVVVLQIGLNDISTGLTCDGPAKDAAPIIAALDQQLSLLAGTGTWTIVETISQPGLAPASGSPLWPAGDVRYTIVDQVNAWIVAQAGRQGVQVLDMRAAFNGGTRQRAAFGTDDIHPSPYGARLEWASLKAILETMVNPGDRYGLADWQTGNLFPNPGLTGTTGSLSSGSGTVAGQVATSWGVQVGTYSSTGALASSGVLSTIAASKETGVAGTWDWQVLTVTPGNGGGADRVHEARLRLASNLSLSGAGVAGGDWMQLAVYAQISPCAGWLEAALLFNPQTSGGTNLNFKWGGLGNSDRLAVGLGLDLTGGYEGWLKLQPFQVAATADRLSSNVAPFIFRFDKTGGQVCTVKLRWPVLRKIADPRPAWNLQ